MLTQLIDQITPHMYFTELRRLKEGYRFGFDGEALDLIYSPKDKKGCIGVHLINPSPQELLNAINKALIVGFKTIYIHKESA